MTEAAAYLGVGSNLGDRRAAIAQAIRGLDAHPEVRVTALSTLIETAPAGGPPQGRYLNGAIAVCTSLEARALLDTCLALEAEQGRDRRRESRWGPRTIDLDLLLYEDAIIDEPGLTVPHPRLHERVFVLVPLREIAASRVHPRLGRSIAVLTDALVDDEETPASFVRISAMEVDAPAVPPRYEGGSVNG